MAQKIVATETFVCGKKSNFFETVFSQEVKNWSKKFQENFFSSLAANLFISEDFSRCFNRNSERKKSILKKIIFIMLKYSLSKIYIFRSSEFNLEFSRFFSRFNPTHG